VVKDCQLEMVVMPGPVLPPGPSQRRLTPPPQPDESAGGIVAGAEASKSRLVIRRSATSAVREVPSVMSLRRSRPTCHDAPTVA